MKQVSLSETWRGCSLICHQSRSHTSSTSPTSLTLSLNLLYSKQNPLATLDSHGGGKTHGTGVGPFSTQNGTGVGRFRDVKSKGTRVVPAQTSRIEKVCCGDAFDESAMRPCCWADSIEFV